MDISYLDYKKKNDIHGTVLYPAPMIAPMQFDVLDKYIDKTQPLSIYDPFHGSSVSLYEATKISPLLEIYGSDINPLANLISKAKLLGVDENINQDVDFVVLMLNSEIKYPIHSFDKIDKWYRQDIIHSLSKIRYVITLVDSLRNRIYLWTMFIDIVRKYSNSRSSTYKLHLKPQEQIDRMTNNAIAAYCEKITSDLNFYITKIDNPIYLYKADSLKLMKEFDNDSFDMIITSPPYGDNKTTVPYGQFSNLALRWISSNDLELENVELDSYSSIDRISMGGKSKVSPLNDNQMLLMSHYLDSISERKRSKVISFMKDYFSFLDDISRLSKKYISLTLGNRTVDKININLTDITVKYLVEKGYSLIENEYRAIPNKRIPAKTSKIDNTSVSSMTKEYLIVFSK
ncbi:hypothetical protein N7603_04935 [Acholeplasma vituli]|uniref:site-specific DNA-methyltransferase (cytosine-N(4)-specific) n=1 Tax=Paracholeplasma vituli TaxID=69473 RepID=A0ABT2PVL4_9MOLU|nr:hypothetical protein [Paracholeplasma vituli]MCU0104996.1 hypothetical protein [Paracholeplasma vituli]